MLRHIDSDPVRNGGIFVIMNTMNHETHRSKDEKWLQACDQMAQIFSTCDKRKYAAFVLAPNSRVVGFGYNGSPPGHAHCNQGACPRLQENSPHGSTYDNCIANHAEANALLYSDLSERKGGTIVVNGPPCFSCSKLIASSGVQRLVHYVDPAYEQWPACVDFLLTSNIEIISVQRPSFTPQTFTTTMAFPPEWTQVKTTWESPPRHGKTYQSPQNCDLDEWEPPSGPIYRGLLPDYNWVRDLPQSP